MNTTLIREEINDLGNKIFLNSAGASLVPRVVTTQMVGYIQEEGKIGGYALAGQFEAQLEDFYRQAALLLNAEAHQIAYTGSATDAFARAMYAVDFKAGDVILTTNEDYISNQLCFLSLQKRLGIRLMRAANLPNGDLDLEDFERLVRVHRPKLVAIVHIPTNSGLVQPAEEVGRICSRYDTLYLLDACQSLGQLVVDVKKIGCDFLTATGRKFLRGPRGTGFLYVSERVLEAGLLPLIFDMQGADWTGADEYRITPTAKRFEFWESSVAGKLGLTAALRYLNGIGIAEVEAYNAALMLRFRHRLQQIDGLLLHDRGARQSNILTFTLAKRSLNETAALLNAHQVYFSQSFRDFALIDFTDKNLAGVTRFSPHYFNTVEELEKVADILSS